MVNRSANIYLIYWQMIIILYVKKTYNFISITVVQFVMHNREIIIHESFNFPNEIGGTSELRRPRLLNQSHLKLEAEPVRSSE